MHRYLLKRDIPGLGKLSADDREAIARQSVDVMDSLRAEVQLVHSHVAVVPPLVQP